VTGLAGTQANAGAAFQAALSAASALGDKAADLATQQELASNAGVLLDRIEQARNDGLISPGTAQELTNLALGGLTGAPDADATPPITDPVVVDVLDQAAQSSGATVTTTTGDETVDASFEDDQGAPGEVLLAAPPLELRELARAKVLNGGVETYEALGLYLGADLAIAESLGLVARDPTDSTRFLVERRLRIVYPAVPFVPSSVAGAGRLPVVMLVHGAHPGWSTEGSIPNLDGYASLQDELARHGIVSVSVDTNAATTFGSEAAVDMRADMVLGAFDSLRALDSDPTSPLFGRVDFERVGLMGHGSGGDAVLEAALLNAQRVPEERIGVEAICLLATTDVRSRTLTRVHTPFLGVVYGGLDGDVTGTDGALGTGMVGTPFRVYDRADCDKAMVFVERAGHNRFNTVWAGADDPLLDPADQARLLAEADHRTLLDEYLGGLFRWRLIGDAEPRALFDGTGTNSLGAEVSLQWSFGAVREVLDDMDPLHPEHGVRILSDSTIETLAEAAPNATGHEAHVLVVPPPAPPTEPRVAYNLEIPTLDVVWSDYDALTFRVGAEYDLTDEASIAADALLDFILFFRGLDTALEVKGSELTSSLVPRRPVFHRVIHNDATIENCTLLRLETMSVPISMLAPLNGLVTSISIITAPGFDRRLFFTSFQLIRH
jgi:hypothetical protein